MTVTYVLNPVRVRRGNVFWFQVTSQRALEIGNLPLVAALEERLSQKKSSSLSALVEHLERVFPTTQKRQRRTTIEELIDQGVLVSRKDAKVLAKRVLAPTLDRVLEALDRQRRKSYDTERAVSRDKALWAPSIFEPLSLDRRVFFSTLLMVAAARDCQYVLRYESTRRMKIKVANNGMETEFDSQYRYLPEDPRAEALVETKSFANYLCQLAGLPVPRQHVCHTLASTCRAASALGFPVVLKPNRGHDGIDVHPHINSEGHLREVMRGLVPKWKGRGGLVLEEHVFGNRYRLTVVGSKIVEARAAYPSVVVGDGKTVLRELVRRENRLRKRTFTRADGGSGIRIDDRVRDLLRRRGLTPESVLARGEKLQLHYTLNRSAGVRSRAATLEDVHPRVQTMAVRAVRLFDLSVGGVDYIAPTLDASPAECGGRICEVQAHPAIIPGDLDYNEFVGKVLDHGMSRGGRAWSWS